MGDKKRLLGPKEFKGGQRGGGGGWGGGGVWGCCLCVWWGVFGGGEDGRGEFTRERIRGNGSGALNEIPCSPIWGMPEARLQGRRTGNEADTSKYKKTPVREKGKGVSGTSVTKFGGSKFRGKDAVSRRTGVRFS